jgi:hypothetical protein
MPFCEVCQRIDIRSLDLAYRNSEAFLVRNTGNDYIDNDVEHLFITPNNQPHHGSSEDLRDAAMNGCEFVV